MTDGAFVVPDLIEPVLGYRSWTVRIHPSGDPVLASPFRRTTWEPRRAHGARCGVTTWSSPFEVRPIARVPPAHAAPAEDCTCGVHAWRTEGTSLLDAADTRGLRAVTGEVALWGAVIRHRRGWRAEQAYPTRLTVHPATTDGLCFAFTWEAGQLRAVPAEDLAPLLADVYGVPVGIDPGVNPLGPLPRYAPSAQRLPRARLGPAADDPPDPQPSLRGRLAGWLARAV